MIRSLVKNDKRFKTDFYKKNLNKNYSNLRKELRTSNLNVKLNSPVHISYENSPKISKLDRK